MLRWITALKTNKKETEDVLWKGKTSQEWKKKVLSNCVTAVRREAIFSIILYKNVSKEEHAGKNPNPDIADSHTPQIIIKIYIPGIYKDLKWFKRGERAQMMRNYAPMQSLQHYTLKNTPWLKYTITDNSNWSWMPIERPLEKEKKIKIRVKDRAGRETK